MKARLPEGYGTGGNDMNAVIRQAQKMQDEMAAKQEELATREFTATSGGGVVEVVMSGDKKIKSLTIKPDVVDPEDVDMLQDLVIAAVNEAYNIVEETSSNEISEITGGLSMPGLF